EFTPSTTKGHVHRFQPRTSISQYSAIITAITQATLKNVNEAVHKRLITGLNGSSARPSMLAPAIAATRTLKVNACDWRARNSRPVQQPNRIVTALPRKLMVT